MIPAYHKYSIIMYNVNVFIPCYSYYMIWLSKKLMIPTYAKLLLPCFSSCFSRCETPVHPGTRCLAEVSCGRDLWIRGGFRVVGLGSWKRPAQRLATKAGWAMLGRPRLGLVRFWTLVEAAELLKLEINGINWKNDPTCYEMAGWWLVLAGFNNHSVHVAFLISGVDPKSCWKKHGSLLNWMVYDMVVLGVIYFIAPRRLFCRCRSMYCRSYIAVTRGNTSRRHGVTSRPSRSLA